MNDRQFRELIVDAIVGVGTGSYAVSQAAEKAGLARFTGNQHNPAWEWRRDALAQIETEALQDLYASLKPDVESEPCDYTPATFNQLTPEQKAAWSRELFRASREQQFIKSFTNAA